MRDSKDSWVKWGIYVTQIWIFIWRTDAEAEAPKPWPPDVKSRLIRKDPDAGKDWKQEEKLVAEEEMVAWHHRPSGHEFVQTLGDSEKEVWHAAVHGVAKSWTQLCNGTTTTTTNLEVACPEPHYLIWIDFLPKKVYLLFLSFFWGNHQWWFNLNWIFTLRSFWSIR